MRSASHAGTRPPCRGRSAVPERFTLLFSPILRNLTPGGMRGYNTLSPLHHEVGAMSEKDLKANSATRRKMLGGMVSAGALLGIGAASTPRASAAEPSAEAAERLLAPARLRSYK